jgi:hypothetical protein
MRRTYIKDGRKLGPVRDGGKRTQSPSSSPDPFSSLEMQERLNKNCRCAQEICLIIGVHATQLGTNGEQIGNRILENTREIERTRTM